MRILLFSDSFYPEKNSAAKLLYDFSEYVSSQKECNIDVFTISRDRKKSEHLNCNVFACILKEHRSKSNLVRGILEFYSGIYFIFLHMRYKFLCKYEYIIYYNPSILQFVFLVYLRIVSPKSKFVLILRDIFPDWAIELGIIRTKPLRAFLSLCKNINIWLADTVFCESKNKLALISSQFPKSDVKILYNWTYFKDLKQHSKISKKYKQFIYAGNIGEAQDILTCSKFIKGLINKGHKVDFYSSGNQLKKLQHKLGPNKHLRFFEPVPMEQLSSLMLDYDGGLVFLAEGLLLDNIPGKILSYLETGLPVFGAVNTGNEIVKIIEKHSLGLLVDSRKHLESCVYYQNVIELCDKLKSEKVREKASLLFNVKEASKKILEKSF